MFLCDFRARKSWFDWL